MSKQVPSQPCIDCGTLVYRRTIRCKVCYEKRRKRPERSCKGCGKTFTPKRLKHATYCSRECAFDAMKRAPFSVVRFCVCIGCGNRFTSKRPKKYCSSDCSPQSQWKSIAPDTRVCRGCGAQFSARPAKTKPLMYCGAACESRAVSERKRIEKAKRKAALRGVTVERVDPFKVFERDGWRCQLCRCHTPASKRGTYADNAPELDHIIPVSCGGEHSYRNTQCACRKCNQIKSDRPLGQMLLVA